MGLDMSWLNERVKAAIDKFELELRSLRPPVGREQIIGYAHIYGPHEEAEFVQDMQDLYGREEAEKLRRLWLLCNNIRLEANSQEATAEDVAAMLEGKVKVEITAEQVAMIENKMRDGLLSRSDEVYVEAVHDSNGMFVFLAETYTSVKDRVSKPVREFAKTIRETGDWKVWKEELRRLDSIARQEGKVKVWHVSLSAGKVPPFCVAFNYKQNCYAILELDPETEDIVNEFLLRDDAPPVTEKVFPKDLKEYKRRSLEFD